MSETEADVISSLIKNIEQRDRNTRRAIYNLILAIEDKLKSHHCQNVTVIVKRFIYYEADLEPTYAELLLKCRDKHYTVGVEIDHDIHVRVRGVEEEE